MLLNWLAGVFVRSSSVVKQIREDVPAYADKEFAYQIAEDQRSSKSEYMSFTGWVKLPYESQTLNINSKGERIVPGQNEVDTASLHFFGGSTMFGVGVEDEASIPAYYGQKDRGKRIINHGQLAYTSRQSLAKLVNLAYLGESLDKVIFYDGVNEVLHLCKNVNQPLDHARTQLFKEKINPEEAGQGPGFFYQLFLQNFVDLRDKLGARQDLINSQSEEAFDTAEYGYDCAMEDEKLDRIAEGLLNNWLSAKAIVEHNGGSFYAFLQPVSFVGNPEISYLDFGKEMIPKKDFALALNYRKFYRLVQEKLAQRGYDWVLDLSAAYDSEQAFYIDHCHVAQPGNVLIADKMFQFIQGHTSQPTE